MKSRPNHLALCVTLQLQRKHRDRLRRRHPPPIFHSRYAQHLPDIRRHQIPPRPSARCASCVGRGFISISSARPPSGSTIKSNPQNPDTPTRRATLHIALSISASSIICTTLDGPRSHQCSITLQAHHRLHLAAHTHRHARPFLARNNRCADTPRVSLRPRPQMRPLLIHEPPLQSPRQPRWPMQQIPRPPRTPRIVHHPLPPAPRRRIRLQHQRAHRTAPSPLQIHFRRNLHRLRPPPPLHPPRSASASSATPPPPTPPGPPPTGPPAPRSHPASRPHASAPVHPPESEIRLSPRNRSPHTCHRPQRIVPIDPLQIPPSPAAGCPRKAIRSSRQPSSRNAIASRAVPIQHPRCRNQHTGALCLPFTHPRSLPVSTYLASRPPSLPVLGGFSHIT